MNTLIEDTDPSIVRVHPGDIQIGDPFCSLFPIDPRERDSIKQSILEDGYRNTSILIGWLEKGILIDGHTRREICIELGQEVLIEWRSYDSPLAAIRDTLKQQTARRNLARDSGAMLRAIQIVDSEIKKQREGGDGSNQHNRKAATTSREVVAPVSTSPEIQSPKGRFQGTSELTAAIVGCSHSTVERARTVLSDPEETEKVIKTGKSINKAAKDVRAKQEKARHYDGESKSIVEKPVDPRPEAKATQEDHGLTFQEKGRRSDAAIFQWIERNRSAWKKELAEIAGVPNTARISPLHRYVRNLLEFPPLAFWPKCRKCEGQNPDQRNCKRCLGFGYEVPEN